MPIVPDTKDWTWVLDKPCPECGFDARAFPLEKLPEMIRSNASAWRKQLGAPHPQAAKRPSDDRWSALEYACHVRDVFRLYDDRLGLMLEQDDPAYPNWDQDQAAIENDYASQSPAAVAGEIEDSGEQIAASFEQVAGDQWKRTGRRSDGANFTVESFARYFIHDPIHHLNDVKIGYEKIASKT